MTNPGRHWEIIADLQKVFFLPIVIGDFLCDGADLNPDFLPLKSRDVRVPKNRRLARIPTPEIGKIWSFSTLQPHNIFLNL